MKTVTETAKIFGVSRITVYNWLHDGLNSSKEKVIGRMTRIIIDPLDVIKYHKEKGER